MSQRQTPSPHRAPTKLRTVSARASTTNLTVTKVFAQPQLSHSGNGDNSESLASDHESLNGDAENKGTEEERKRSGSVSSNYNQRRNGTSRSPARIIPIQQSTRVGTSNKNSPVASFEERESRIGRKSSMGWLKEIARKHSKDSLRVARDTPMLTAEPLPMELATEPLGLPTIISTSPPDNTSEADIEVNIASLTAVAVSPPTQIQEDLSTTTTSNPTDVPPTSPLTPEPKATSTTAPAAPSPSSSNWFRSVRKSSIPRPQPTPSTPGAAKTSSSPTRAFTISTTSASSPRPSIPRYTPPSSPSPATSSPINSKKEESPGIRGLSKGTSSTPSADDNTPTKRKSSLLGRPSSPISRKKVTKTSIPAPISISSAASKTAPVVTSINSPVLEPLPARSDMPTLIISGSPTDVAHRNIDSETSKLSRVDPQPISTVPNESSSALPDSNQSQEPVVQTQEPGPITSDQTISSTPLTAPVTPSKAPSAPPRTSSPALSLPKGWFSSIRPNSPSRSTSASASVKGKEKEKEKVKVEEPESAGSNTKTEQAAPAISADSQTASAVPITAESSGPSVLTATKPEEPVAAEIIVEAAASSLAVTSDTIPVNVAAPTEVPLTPAPLPYNSGSEPVAAVVVSPPPAQASRGWFGLYKPVSNTSQAASIKERAKEEPSMVILVNDSTSQGGETAPGKAEDEVKAPEVKVAEVDVVLPPSSREDLTPPTIQTRTEGEYPINRDLPVAKPDQAPAAIPIASDTVSTALASTPTLTPVSRGWFGAYRLNSNSSVSLPKPTPTKLKEEVVVEVENDHPAENTTVEPQQTSDPTAKPEINDPPPPVVIVNDSQSEEPHVLGVAETSSPVYRGWFGSSTPTKIKSPSGGQDGSGKSRVSTEGAKGAEQIIKVDEGLAIGSTTQPKLDLQHDASNAVPQDSPVPGDVGDQSGAATPVTLPAPISNGTLPSARYTLGLPLLGRRFKKGNAESKSPINAGTATELESPMQRRDGEVDSIKSSIENLRDLIPSGGADEDRNKGTKPSTALTSGTATTRTVDAIDSTPTATSASMLQVPDPRISELSSGPVNSDDVSGKPEGQNGPTSYSWWSYIGLGAPVENSTAAAPTSLMPDYGAPPPASLGGKADRVDHNGGAVRASAVDEQEVDKALPIPHSDGNSAINQSNEDDQRGTSVAQDHREPTPAMPLEEGATTSTWVGPLWSWMYPSAGTAASDINSADEQRPDVRKTEAELVKEEALRRDSEASVQQENGQSDQSEPFPTSPSIDSNPVVTHAPSSSWLSFFSNKNMAAVKRLQDGNTVGQDGMEVMEVEDVGVDGTLSSQEQVNFSALVTGSSIPPPAKNALPPNDLPPRSRTTSDDRGRRSRSGSISGAYYSGPSSGSAVGTKDGKGVAVPLTTSDTIKRKASAINASVIPPKKGQSAPSTRNGSPAPSKPSTSGKEKMPSFILPTFGDTFFTLPRVAPPPNVVPVATRSQRKQSLRGTLAKKTLSLVSGLLGTQPPAKQPPMEEERPPTDEMLRYMEERSERLAQSLLQSSPPNSPVRGSGSSTHSEPAPPSGPTASISSRSGTNPRTTPSSASIRSGKSASLAMIPVGRIAAKGHYHLSNLPHQINAAKHIGRDLPRLWNTLGQDQFGSPGAPRKVVIIGIHGWFPGAVIRNLLGEPTGTSSKFAAMMKDAVEAYMEQCGMELEKLTVITLEGEGTIARRVAKHYQDFLDKPEWVCDVHNADVIFVATHSQGSIVSTQLIASLVQDGHIRTTLNHEAVQRATETSGTVAPPYPTRVLCLAQCGIHLGPLLYLNTSSLTTPYFTYFESPAAKELFEFQDTASEVSQKYVASLATALDHGVKFVYIASLDDQVVPIYSGVFMTASHPLILRALYVDGDAYSESDFLSNLIVFLLRIRNAGLDDSGLLNHLSEATAGSLSGVGHSNPYSNTGCYELAVRFLFETSGVLGSEKPTLHVEPFQARATRNDYEIPWALRGIFSDPAITSLFAVEMVQLRMAFDEWRPKTSLLKELRRKLEPIQSIRILPPSPLALHHTQDDEGDDHDAASVLRTYSRL